MWNAFYINASEKNNPMSMGTLIFETLHFSNNTYFYL